MNIAANVDSGAAPNSPHAGLFRPFTRVLRRLYAAAAVYGEAMGLRSAVDPCENGAAAIKGNALTHGIDLDRSRFPLVVLRASAKHTQADWDGMMEGMISLIKTAPFALINDTRGSRMPDAIQRRSIATMYADHEAEVRKNFLASGIVGSSSLVNGVLTALNWLKPPPHPVKVFRSVEAAEAWVLTHFSKEMQAAVANASAQNVARFARAR
jgi:hypothetical protein